MAGLLAVIAAVILAIYGLAYLNETQNDRIRAEAYAQTVVIQAASDARFRDAQSTAVTMTATLPIVMVLTGGAVMLAWAVVVAKRNPKTQIIERQIVFVLSAGSPRRQLWQTLSDSRPELVKLPERIIEVKQ